LLECSGQGLGNDDMDGEILELHGDVCEPARAYIYTHVGAGRVVRVARRCVMGEQGGHHFAFWFVGTKLKELAQRHSTPRSKRSRSLLKKKRSRARHDNNEQA
jgi:hypothetical protein